jgi:hypothetical protein
MAGSVPNVPSNVLPPGVLEESLLDAVSRSGYPLQTVIGARLLARKYRLEEEWPFIDADSGETRTLDISASRGLQDEPTKTESGDTFWMIALLTECKQAELPYVAFEAVSPADYSSFPAIAGLARAELDISTDTVRNRMWRVRPQQFLDLQSHSFVRTPPVASSLSAVHRKGKEFEVSGDQAYRNIVFPLTKALLHYRRYFQYRETFRNSIRPRVILAIAVFDAPLYLANVPTAKAAIEPAAWIRVVRRHTTPERDLWREPTPSMVDLVHKDFFDEYLTRYVHPFARVVQRRMSGHQDVMLSGKAFVPGLSFGRPLPKDLYKRVQPEPPDLPN